nr:Druantia anti-phage system protein DruA [Acidithrix sp. C25]
MHPLPCRSPPPPGDWLLAYGYQPVLLETFVESARFTEASYKAANWIRVGQTKGRGKLDRYNQYALSVKDVYLYPLHRDYRSILDSPE